MERVSMQSEAYTIKTVGDLIAELEKYDKDMPILKSELCPVQIARVKLQEVPRYELGGKVAGMYKAVVIR